MFHSDVRPRVDKIRLTVLLSSILSVTGHNGGRHVFGLVNTGYNDVELVNELQVDHTSF